MSAGRLKTTEMWLCLGITMWLCGDYYYGVVMTLLLRSDTKFIRCTVARHFITLMTNNGTGKTCFIYLNLLINAQRVRTAHEVSCHNFSLVSNLYFAFISLLKMMVSYARAL